MVLHFDIYKDEGRWFFNDDERHIYKEEFVSGVPEIILELAKNPNAQRVSVEVSTVPIVAADGILDYVPTSNNNDVYYQLGSIRGWFCPVFRKYFRDPPPTLWVRVLKVQ